LLALPSAALGVRFIGSPALGWGRVAAA
jgi:hypothetical protein